MTVNNRFDAAVWRAPVEDRYEVRPTGVPVLRAEQVLAESLAQGPLSQQLLQVSHDDRCLLVDDGTIERAGLVQVVEGLADGVRALGPVDAVGAGVVREEEPEVVIDLGKRRIDDLGREEVREHLLHPDVSEPGHGD